MKHVWVGKIYDHLKLTHDVLKELLDSDTYLTLISCILYLLGIICTDLFNDM